MGLFGILLARLGRRVRAVGSACGEDTGMSELRQRMLEDMRLAGLAETTQERYVRAVRRLVKTFMRPPDEITEAEIRRYVLDMRDRRHCAEGTLRANWYGIKFFYANTLGVDWPLFGGEKGRDSEAPAYARGHRRRGVPPPAGGGRAGEVPSVFLPHVRLRAAQP